MNFNICTAEPSEIEWVNSKYDEIGFQHANTDDLVAIAELENTEKIGLGRLVRLTENNLELAGIYVFESYRNRGAARKIIEFLMMNLHPNELCVAHSNRLSMQRKSLLTPVDLIP